MLNTFIASNMGKFMEENPSIPKPIKQLKDGSYMTHDQVLHFKDGTKRYVQKVKYIWENEMTHLVCEDGTEFIINKSNLNFIERRLKFENDKL